MTEGILGFRGSSQRNRSAAFGMPCCMRHCNRNRQGCKECEESDARERIVASLGLSGKAEQSEAASDARRLDVSLHRAVGTPHATPSIHDVVLSLTMFRVPAVPPPTPTPPLAAAFSAAAVAAALLSESTGLAPEGAAGKSSRLSYTYYHTSPNITIHFVRRQLPSA
jgi:hypothetical protein